MIPTDAKVRSEHGQLLSDLEQREWTFEGRMRSFIKTVARKVQPAIQPALAAKKKLDWNSSQRILCSYCYS
jgi:hypothetical protein